MKDDRIYEIPLKDIDISGLNVRHQDILTDIDELKASIKKYGLLQPVTLLGEFGKPKYTLISGQRRYVAHDQLGLPTIRAMFEQGLDETQIIIHSLVENMQRLDLDYVDTAKAITQLYKTYGNDERKVAEETGLSLRKVRDFISVDALATDQMKKLLTEGKISAADVKRAIRASAGNQAKAEELLKLMATKFRLSSSQKKRLVYYGEQNPGDTAEAIIQKAAAPHIEETVVVPLPDDIKKAVMLAMKEMELEVEEFVQKALRDWLHEKGFLGK
jgi:ParB family chromosome partitioning protein